MQKLKPKILRHQKPKPREKAAIIRYPLYLILDDVWDTYNIGSLFRLADATGVAKIYICGDSEYPPNSRIHKAAVGTENWITWEKRGTAIEVVEELKNLPAGRQDIQIVAVEQDPRAISYMLLPKHLTFPVAVVVGHETNGVSREVLDASDIIVELPMHGINHSFNVWGTTAVVLYKILENI